MSEKLFNSSDILKLVSKIEKRIDKLECWIEDCCAKIPVNIGNGIGLFKKYYKGHWQFKSILAGSNVTITEQENTITINSTGGGGSFTCEDVNDCLGISEAGNPVYFLNQQGDWDTISLTGTENRILYFNGLGELETSPQLSYGAGQLFISNNISGGYFNSSAGESSIGVTSNIGSPSGYDSRFYTTPNYVGWEIPLLSTDSFRLPVTDGNSGDVMTTDGNGNITFQPVGGGGFTCTDLNSCSTTNLPEGTNLYYTQARFNSAFSAKSTSDLSEGTNLYFTNSRAITALTGQNISLFTNDSGYITSSALSPYLTIASAALTYYPLTNPSGYTSNTGTVTTLSVATANGFSGTVSNPSTTPEITIDASGLDVSKLADGTVSNTEFQYINSLTSNAQTQLDAKTFSVPFLANQFDPLDATNYFFGGITNLLAPSTTNTNQDFVIGYACTVVGCVIQAHGNTTQGSSEDVALSLRNNTANTTTSMGNFKTNATSTTTVVTAITGLNISVVASELICLQMNGTWATNPTQVRLTGYLIIRL